MAVTPGLSTFIEQNENSPVNVYDWATGTTRRQIIRGDSKRQSLYRDPLEASRIHSIDAQTGKVERVLDEPTERIVAVAFGPRSAQLTTATGNQVIRVWDLAIGQDVQSYSHPGTTMMRAFLSMDGRRFVFLSSGKVQIWALARLPLLGAN